MAAIQLLRRLLSGLRRGALERQLDDELAFHREMLKRDYEQRGLSANEAADAARRQLGNALSLRERSAESWGFPSLEGVAQDLRYGARMLRRSPAFAMVAVGAIGLAIGINAGLFTLVDALLWSPIPVADPSRLVKLLIVDGRQSENLRFSSTDYATIAGHAASVRDVFGYTAELVALRASFAAGNAEAVSGGFVSGNYFMALGGVASIGRLLAPGDDRDGAPPAVVISDIFWRRAFAASPAVVGGDVVINGTHATVVGVARQDFRGINPLEPDLWMPLTLAARAGATPGRLGDPANRFIALYGRLRQGVSMAQAAAELSGLVREPPAAAGTRAELTRIIGVHLLPNDSAIPVNAETLLVAAPGLFIVALVLVIACANLANLLLSRALVRQREIAVRLALGASRARLLRQLLTESMLIALLGAALGLVLANWTVSVVSRSLFSALPITLGTLVLSLHQSWRVLAYTLTLACVSVLIFGLAPALQATSPNLTAALKGEDAVFGTRIRRSRFRDGLVAIQVAACAVLLVAAGTLVQSMRAQATVDTGLDPRHVTVARLGLAADGQVPARLAAARAAFAARAAALPGVVATASVTQPPFSAFPLLHVADAASRDPLRGIAYDRVTPRYFEVVGQRLIDGLGFSAVDSSAGAPVAVVTAAAARALWPGKAPVGQSFRVAGGADSADRVVRVIGVAADARSGTIWDSDGAGYIYLPASPADLATFDVQLLVRADPRARDPARALADIARAIDPDSPLRVTALAETFAAQLVPFKYGAFVATGVGAIGLVLALVGLYGVVAFAVAQRRRELAVHLAMGATARQVLGLLLRREMRLVATGLAIGLVLAAGIARVLGSLVIPLSPLGAGGFVLLAVFLLLVATMATLVPGLGAMRIAPMQALRQE